MLRYNKDTGTMSMIVKDTGTLALRIKSYALGEGDEVVFTINDVREDDTPLVQKTITEFRADGRAVVYLTSADTDVQPGNYLYDIQVNYADGRVDTIVGPARFKFEGGVTY